MKNLFKDTYLYSTCVKSNRIYFPQEVQDNTGTNFYKYVDFYSGKQYTADAARKYLKGN